MDETYIRVGGRWTYLYRAVDKHGLTVDFLLSEHRDVSAAKQFFTGAIERYGAPERVTLEGYPATHSAVAGLKKSGILRPQTKVWTSKYLNNIMEQGHRRVKQRVYPMLGSKQFRNAAETSSGIELVQKIKKGQFDILWVALGARVPVAHVWDIVIAASAQGHRTDARPELLFAPEPPQGDWALTKRLPPAALKPRPSEAARRNVIKP